MIPVMFLNYYQSKVMNKTFDFVSGEMSCFERNFQLKNMYNAQKFKFNEH